MQTVVDYVSTLPKRKQIVSSKWYKATSQLKMLSSTGLDSIKCRTINVVSENVLANYENKTDVVHTFREFEHRTNVWIKFRL